MKNSLALLFLLLSIGSSQVRAEITHDFANWNGVLLQGKLAGNFEFYLETQNRINQALTNRNSLIIRPALRYLVTPNWSVWLGYGWMPAVNPYRLENRIWQQIFYQENVGLWQLVGRLRFEERWLAQAQGVSSRGRFMFRTLRFFDDNRKFALCTWDELFYNLNSVVGGPSGGFDQNRVFIGFNIRVATNVQLEPGYLNLLIKQSDLQNDLMSHALAVYTIINF